MIGEAIYHFWKRGSMTRIDQCPMCGSLNATALDKDGTRYNPFIRNARLWANFRCDECGRVWPFTFITIHGSETAQEAGSGAGSAHPPLEEKSEQEGQGGIYEH